MFTDLFKFFDSYNRVARLYPALLTAMPVVWTLWAARAGIVTIDIMHIVVSAFVAFGGTYFLATIARSRGKNMEAILLKAWNGWPTTILLRHEDNTIDLLTKARYHARLQEICPNIIFPSAQEEAKDTAAADAKYRAATRCLIELRRDPKYNFVHYENASYGFRRNLLGLKPIALAVLLIMLLFSVWLWWSAWIPQVRSLDSLTTDFWYRWKIYVALFVDAFFMVAWMTIVRPTFVRQAANEYAEALFKTL